VATFNVHTGHHDRLADDDDDEGEDEDEMTTDGAPLAAGRAGHRATARGDDDDDDEMDDFLANMDMDAIEEDIVAPPPSTHVDKRRRVEPRAAPKSVVSAARAPVPAATAVPARQGRGGHQHEQDMVVPLNEAASICASSPDTVALVEVGWSVQFVLLCPSLRCDGNQQSLSLSRCFSRDKRNAVLLWQRRMECGASMCISREVDTQNKCTWVTAFSRQHSECQWMNLLDESGPARRIPTKRKSSTRYERWVCYGILMARPCYAWLT
jgi:hypothetical protein